MSGRGSDTLADEVAKAANVASAPQPEGRWCIVRTSGPRTLALVESLNDQGIAAWAPTRTIRRPIPHTRPNEHGRRPLREIPAPVLPTYVFVRAQHLPELRRAEHDQTEGKRASPHPQFSILRLRDRIPEVGDAEVSGLREEERAAAELIRLMREAESREEAESIRIAAMKDEQDRRRAQAAAERARRKELSAERLAGMRSGDQVRVQNAPAFEGMTGIVESSDGRFALVVFGGTMSMKVEAWQLASDPIQERSS